MADWLRPKFQRAPSSFLDEDPNDHDRTDRNRTSSRVGSYLGLTSTRAPSPVPSGSTNESFLIKSPDIIYERPSVDQMIESLKVAMMTKSSMDPLPIEHNSSILHLLEAYQDIKAHLESKDQIIHEIQEGHTEAIHNYEDKLSKWEAKEKDYKSEMKNLEVLLANTEGGLEKVTMARTNSVLERALHRKSKIETSENSARSRRQRNLHHRGPVIRAIPPKRAPTLRTTFDVEYWRQQQVAYIPKHKRRLPHGVDNSAALGLGLSYTQDGLDQPHIETDLGMEFDSSESSQSFSSTSGLSMADKPLPAIPKIETTDPPALIDKSTKSPTMPDSPWVDPGQTDRIKIQRQGFSYRAGDDDQEMFSTGETARARKKRTTLGEQQRQQAHARSFPPCKAEEAPNTQIQNVAKTLESAGSLNPQSSQLRPTSSTELKHERHLNDRLQRCDSSNSSVVTAVRDNSGRSSGSAEGSNGRPGLNRRQGSNDTAAIAARRAIASRNSRSESSEASQTRKTNLNTASKEDNESKKNGKQNEAGGLGDPAQVKMNNSA